MIQIEKIEDERGFFARIWDQKQFKNNGLNPKLVQCNISFNKKKGIIRGMHYQTSPYAEDKLIRCTRGSMFDVVIDLRPKSKTFKKWIGIKMNAEDYIMLYVPKGFAQGFQTLEDNTEIIYQMSKIYKPEYARGIPWNDPTFDIKWPLKCPILSKKDRSWTPIE